MLCHHERVQPACEQSLRAGHAYTATLDQQGSGGLGLRASLVVGDALPFNNLPIDNGSGSVSLLCSDAAGTGLVELQLGIFIAVWVWLQSGSGSQKLIMLPCVALCMAGCVHLVCRGPIIATSCTA